MANELYIHTLRQLRDGCLGENMDTEAEALEAAIQALSCDIGQVYRTLKQLQSAQPEKRTEERTETHACDLVSRQAAIDELGYCQTYLFDSRDKDKKISLEAAEYAIEQLPSAQPEIIRCKDCKWWRQQTNYQGAPLSFGFCESDDMWRSLYGETNEVAHIDTDDDFYCGYEERREK